MQTYLFTHLRMDKTSYVISLFYISNMTQTCCYIKIIRDGLVWCNLSMLSRKHNALRPEGWSVCLCVCMHTGLGSVEESKAQCISGPDQERGGEEDDWETDDVGGTFSSQEEHQNLQRDCGGEVRDRHYNYYITVLPAVFPTYSYLF